MFFVLCSGFLSRFESREANIPDSMCYYVLVGGYQLQATHDATKTQNTILKTYSKLSLFIFLTLYQHLGSKGANVCVLCSISPDRLNQAESSRYEIHAVNVRDHMSGVTSRCLEQLGYCEHCSNTVNPILRVFY